MINNFDLIEEFSWSSIFQANAINYLKNLLVYVNVNNLHELSFIEKKGNTLSVSLVHRLDVETLLIFNFFEDQCSIWYSECNVIITDLDDENKLSVFNDILRGRYISEDYFWKKNRIYSVYKLLTNNYFPDYVIPIKPFSRLFVKIFNVKLVCKEVKYQSFI